MFLIFIVSGRTWYHSGFKSCLGQLLSNWLTLPSFESLHTCIHLHCVYTCTYMYTMYMYMYVYVYVHTQEYYYAFPLPVYCRHTVNSVSWCWWSVLTPVVTLVVATYYQTTSPTAPTGERLYVVYMMYIFTCTCTCKCTVF